MNLIIKIRAVTLTASSARAPARGKVGKNARGSQELVHTSVGAGAMIARTSRGAGKYERLPIGVCSIIQIYSRSPDRTGATNLMDDFGQNMVRFPSNHWTILGRFLAASTWQKSLRKSPI